MVRTPGQFRRSRSPPTIPTSRHLPSPLDDRFLGRGGELIEHGDDMMRPLRSGAKANAAGRSDPATGARGFLSGFTQVLGCDHGHSGRM